MSNATLAPTLDLLRKVLGLEIRQGYRNRSTSGAGIHTFFRLQFEKYEFDEAMWATAESILAYLRRYEAAASVEERERLVQVMLKKLNATQGRTQDGQPAVDAKPSGEPAGSSPTAPPLVTATSKPSTAMEKPVAHVTPSERHETRGREPETVHEAPRQDPLDLQLEPNGKAS
ncbi:MAG: hypothetical protein JWO42_996, partial [Chloroflexi bacterium]|nr:hypothetical protein [Chloroflexota bacterium]